MFAPTRLFSVMFVLVGLVVACNSESKLGEECDESGKDGECESGAVCGQNTAGGLMCLKSCVEQTDCPTDQECNGVAGTSAKGCRPKTGSGASTGGKK